MFDPVSRANSFLGFIGIELIESIAMVEEVSREVKRSLFQRLFKRPWRPFQETRTVLLPVGEPCTFAACPPGPFIHGGLAALKTEYNAANGGEAFNEVGEAWWGRTSTKEARAAVIVQPCEYRRVDLTSVPCPVCGSRMVRRFRGDVHRPVFTWQCSNAPDCLGEIGPSPVQEAINSLTEIKAWLERMPLTSPEWRAQITATWSNEFDPKSVRDNPQDLGD